MRGSEERVMLCLEIGVCGDLVQPRVLQEPGETVAPHVPEVPLQSSQAGPRVETPDLTPSNPPLLGPHPCGEPHH